MTMEYCHRKFLMLIFSICIAKIKSESNDTSVINYAGSLGSERKCGDNFFQCLSGHCIFRVYRCNHHADCFDASDEIDCDPGCPGFTCNDGKCIDGRLVCNQQSNCAEGEDENETLCLHDKDSSKNKVQLKYEHESWHFNAIYSVVAGIIGLLCVIAIVVITVCRLYIRREAEQHMRARAESSRRRHELRRQQRLNQLQRCLQNDPDLLESYFIRENLCALNSNATNLSLNINLNLNSSVEETPLMLLPPPYSEEGSSPAPIDDSPPPPYSTLDRNNRNAIQGQERVERETEQSPSQGVQDQSMSAIDME